MDGKKRMNFLDKLPWSIIIIGCLSLGLAPFAPPHIWEKLLMLKNGTLSRPIDWFDLFYHSIPWVLLILKVMAGVKKN
ncbi:MAG: RND transporter [Nitrospirota bacterium]|nr:RND transporter [Nitrospirota bacterium]